MMRIVPPMRGFCRKASVSAAMTGESGRGLAVSCWRLSTWLAGGGQFALRTGRSKSDLQVLQSRGTLDRRERDGGDQWWMAAAS
jgi:hypothetical protein